MVKRNVIKALFALAFICSSTTLLFAWGAWGHKHISRSAVFALPIEMRIFYYNHIDFITEGAVVPDLRRGLLNDKAEAPRHYIDLEDFGKVSIEAMPKTFKEANVKYDSTFLQKTGTLPWYIQSLMDKLTIAFTRKNKSDILFLSAELGHYIADAHVPLHTSSNHDGQLTNQKGIHAFWESRIPELLGRNYNLYTGGAKYLNDVTAATWSIIKHSHTLVDTLLLAEKTVKANFAKDKLYKKDDSGKVVLYFNQPVYANEYTIQYNQSLKGMVENQMRLSITALADFWYTAWVNAGKPNLTNLDDDNLTNQNKKNLKREYKSWLKGKILNLNTNKE